VDQLIGLPFVRVKFPEPVERDALNWICDQHLPVAFEHLFLRLLRGERSSQEQGDGEKSADGHAAMAARWVIEAETIARSGAKTTARALTAPPARCAHGPAPNRLCHRASGPVPRPGRVPPPCAGGKW